MPTGLDDDHPFLLLGSTRNDEEPLALGDVVINLQGQVVAVPEPSTYALFLGGLAWLLVCHRRLQQQRRDACVSDFLSR